MKMLFGMIEKMKKEERRYDKMSILSLLETAWDKSQFKTLEQYISFAEGFLKYLDEDEPTILDAHNDSNYMFFEYNIEDLDGSNRRCITRPINKSLMYNIEDFLKKKEIFLNDLELLEKSQIHANVVDRSNINKFIYTLQQCLGCTYDACDADEKNKARKLNGDLFERLITLVIQRIGINCHSGTHKIPVVIADKEKFTMNFQLDIIIDDDIGIPKLIGSAKTTSKDRIDKIFSDKNLYNKLTDGDFPFIAIFLHDVQRKKRRGVDEEYGIQSTFKSGHYKVYTIKVNPLDGTYFLDVRPNMVSDTFLCRYIKTFDCLLCNDIWGLI